MQNNYDNNIEFDYSDSSLFSEEPITQNEEIEEQQYLKVNEFERDINTGNYNKFTEESKYVREILNNPYARMTFRASDEYVLFDDFNIIKNFIDIHSNYQNKRSAILQNYYEGKNTAILYFNNRRRQVNKSDNRIITPFARKIVETHVAYSFSNEIKINDSNKKVDAFVNTLFNRTQLNAHNKRLATDVLTFGHAFEINYRNKRGKNILKNLSVYNTFVIYTDDLEEEPICAVYYTITKKHINITLYFSDYIIYLNDIPLSTYDTITEFPDIDEENIGFNGFGGVQIIEYKNNDEKLSVFEPVISLIDAHDSIMSDIINVSNDTPDALLKIKGVLSKKSLSAFNSSVMKDSNAIYLEPGETPDGSNYSEVDASYMTSNYDVNANKIITDILKDLIYTQSNTPNFSDSSFGSVTSGIVMQYRLYATETVAEITQTSFKEGLAMRYMLWSRLYTFLKDTTYSNLDVDQLLFIFVENVPVNIFERIDAIVKNGGKISNKTLLEYLPNSDYETEIKRLKEEQ